MDIKENLEVKENFTERNNHFLLPSDIRGLIIGDSGCGKTQLLLNMLLKGLDFNTLYVFGKCLHQPEYKIIKKGFEENLPKETILNIIRNIKEIQSKDISPYALIDEVGKYVPQKEDIKCQFFEKPDEVPDPNNLKTTDKNLIIFDDLVADRKQDKCVDYYVRGRHNNINCFYLTQNYIEVDKHFIRQNTNFICLFEQDENNLKNVYNEHASRDMPLSEFKQFCKTCWTQPHDFLVIDKTSHKYNGKYRYLLDNFYYPKGIN